MGGATVSLRAISVVSTIFLARILDPRDFGIVALAWIVLTTTNLFSGFGLGAAVIQSQEDRRKVAFQAFVVTALSGTLLTVLVASLAGFFAGLLSNPGISSVLQWMSLLVFFGTLTIVPEALLQKDLLFGRVSTAMVGMELLYVGSALTFALTGFGLWSLVYASLLKSALGMVSLWILCPGWDWIIPKPWDGKLMKRLLAYGIQSTGGGIATFLYSIVDNLAVGRWLGATALGFYSKAYDFTSRTVDSINNVIGAVLLPSYATIQTDQIRLSRAFLKSVRLISFLTVPVALGMFITAPEMIGTLLGEKWMPMVPAFQILSIVSLVKPLSASTSALFMSTGRPVFNLRAGLVVIAVMVPLIVLLIGVGIEGIAFAVLGGHVAGFVFNVYQVHRVLPGNAGRMLTAVVPAVISAVCMGVVVYLVKAPLVYLAGGGTSIAALFAMVGAGVMVYAAVLFGLQRQLVLEVLGLALGRFGPGHAWKGR